MVKARLYYSFYFVFISIVFILLIWNFGTKEVHLISITSIILTSTLYVLADKNIIVDKVKKLHSFSLFNLIKIYNRRGGFKFAIFIVIGSVIVGIISIHFLTKKLNLGGEILPNNIDLKKTILITNSLGVIASQLGGWFFQSILLYMIVYILDGENSFKNYLTIVGLSYISFLLSSIISLYYNYFFMPYFNSLFDFKNAMENNFFLNILGKISEYLSLTLIAFGIYITENFSLSKSLIISFLPSTFLLLLKIIFEYLL